MAVVAVAGAPVAVQQRMAAAMVHVAAVLVVPVVVARAAVHAPVARPLHAVAPVAVVMKVAAAAIATTIRNPHAPMPTWVHTRATATPATATRATRPVDSLTRCAPA